MEFKASFECDLERLLGRLGSLAFLNCGAVESNHRVLLNFQVIFLNVLIPKSDVAVVTVGIYHEADRTGLRQPIKIAPRFSLANQIGRASCRARGKNRVST